MQSWILSVPIDIYIAFYETLPQEVGVAIVINDQ